MNYKILLASLLPFIAFGMKVETKKHEIKFAQVATTEEQKEWLADLSHAIEDYSAAYISKTFTNSSKETCLNRIKKLIAKLVAQEAINYTDDQTSRNFPLYHACHYNLKDIVKLLIDAGADVNLRNSFLMTPLHKVISRHDGISIVELLINKGADINAQNASLEIPLHQASSVELITLLLEAGSHLEALDAFNQTPLLYFIFEMKYDIERQRLLNAASTLLSYGANIYAQNKNHKTAYELLKPYMLNLDETIKIGKQECNKRIIQQLARKTQQKLQNDWLKFAQSTYPNIKSSIINVSKTQISFDPVIASTRCQALSKIN